MSNVLPNDSQYAVDSCDFSSYHSNLTDLGGEQPTLSAHNPAHMTTLTQQRMLLHLILRLMQMQVMIQLAKVGKSWCQGRSAPVKGVKTYPLGTLLEVLVHPITLH
jgi:hypothetical protein